MIFELDNTDIQIHRALAADMEKHTLQSVAASIHFEYEELAKSLKKEELSNHLKLLNIYLDELLLRTQISHLKFKETLH